jgi:2-C-methyl-D-erythritol 2,4-cyclodiphosphate synthase
VIGGVDDRAREGLLGHSDADVLLHAICDALLGAARAGRHRPAFPGLRQRYQGIDSRELLRHVRELRARSGTARGERRRHDHRRGPRMAPHIPKMVENIAADLGAAKNAREREGDDHREARDSSVRGEGIAAQAIACRNGTVIPAYAEI